MYKFNRSAANQSLSTPQSPMLALPAGPRSIGFLINFDGLISGDNPQYVLSTGALASAGSLNVYYNTAATSSALASRIAVLAHTQSASTPLLLSQPLTAGCHLVLIDCDGTTATLRHCPVLPLEPVDGRAVVRAASSTNSNIVRELDGAAWTIGSRSDGAANRRCDQSLGRFFYAKRVLTDFEMAQLAFGKEITGIGIEPEVYVRMSSVHDIIDRGPHSLPFSATGASTSSAEPAFGYTPQDEAPVGTDAISVTLADSHRVHRMSERAATVQFQGAYIGAAPTSVDVQLYAADRTTVLVPWTEVSPATIGNDLWNGSLPIPRGGPFFPKARARNGAIVLAESAVSATGLLAGALGAVIGSSSASRLFTDDSGVGYTPAPDTAVLSGAVPAWAPMSDTGSGTLFAAHMTNELDMPVGLLNYGVSGTTLARWLERSGNDTPWQKFAHGVSVAGGKLDFVYITVGSNDASAGRIGSRALHLENMRRLIADVRALTGQPDLRIFWVGSNSRPGLPTQQANWLRMAEEEIGKDPNVFHVANTDLPILADDLVHMTPAGFAALAPRVAYVGGAAMRTGLKLRGPKVVRFEYWGNKVRVTVEHRNEGASALNPGSGLTGFSVTVDGAAAALVAIEVLSGTQVELTLDRSTEGAAVVVAYQAGGAPDVTAPVFDNGRIALPMVTQTELAAMRVPQEPPVAVGIDGAQLPASRKVVFPGGTRVVAFGSQPHRAVPHAPYHDGERWWVDKYPEDERYYVADIALDLAEARSSATQVDAIVGGVTLLEQPVIQGSLIAVKLGGFDGAAGARNYCTLRVTLANGEQFDRTLWLRAPDGQWALAKAPEDKRFYVADIGNDLIDSNTTATSATALPAGVVALAQPQIQGRLVVFKLGGMDTSADASNHCKLRIDCANGERFYRTIHFNRVDN